MKQTLFAILFSVSVFAQFGAGIIDAENPQPTKIAVYPNPATSFISIDNADNVKQIAVFNLVGKRLKTFDNVVKDERYDVSDLPNGMYLVQIIDLSNKIVTTQRVSKK